MGRRPTVNSNLPAGMRARRRGEVTYYYYDTGGKPRKEIALGTDYPMAVKKWAELEIDAKPVHLALVTLKYAADRYLLSRLFKEKAARTQRDYEAQLVFIMKFFNDPPAPLSGIKPHSIQQYMEWRGQSAPVRANRERALISTIWNFARSSGITDLPNPCAGVKGFTEEGRDVYIEDSVFEAVWKEADVALRDALDLAYLTGQRPADVLKMKEPDIREGVLWINQGKTKKKLRMGISGQLVDVIKRIMERKQTFKVRSLALVCNESGQQLGREALRYRFDAARVAAIKANPRLKDAIEAYQFRDLRAKAGTDKADSGDMVQAQKQLGHSTIKMTEHYVRARAGEKVEPTK
ncbi:Site-specific recombinase XerC [Nitrosospira sp. Nsp11]|uniref:tyrosine-type recombinase/integrase n=1 Tax=Nitrosospira sp. Nsp11 TaxID=1855338 RepID=UPI0009205012|nr:tyrosine-type recombinase/integrase [Nitrosospira sp. Nsp11]SHM04779.1 Site-specific recombinase XerC [Nitrosospira sp. Nsp11]